MSIVFDSFAWIEYFSGAPKGKEVEGVLKSGELIYTPAICLTEIKNRFSRANFDSAEIEKFISFALRHSMILPIDEHIALSAADLIKKMGLHTVDAIIYASALSVEGRLLTGDAHFKNVPNVEFLG